MQKLLVYNLNVKVITVQKTINSNDVFLLLQIQTTIDSVPNTSYDKVHDNNGWVTRKSTTINKPHTEHLKLISRRELL